MGINKFAVLTNDVLTFKRLHYLPEQWDTFICGTVAHTILRTIKPYLVATGGIEPPRM
jgi:hypothetical protein